MYDRFILGVKLFTIKGSINTNKHITHYLHILENPHSLNKFVNQTWSNLISLFSILTHSVHQTFRTSCAYFDCKLQQSTFQSLWFSTSSIANDYKDLFAFRPLSHTYTNRRQKPPFVINPTARKICFVLYMWSLPECDCSHIFQGRFSC